MYVNEDGSANNSKVVEESNSFFFNGELLLSLVLHLAAKMNVLSRTDSGLPSELKQDLTKRL